MYFVLEEKKVTVKGEQTQSSSAIRAVELENAKNIYCKHDMHPPYAQITHLGLEGIAYIWLFSIDSVN